MAESSRLVGAFQSFIDQRIEIGNHCVHIRFDSEHCVNDSESSGVLFGTHDSPMHNQICGASITLPEIVE